MLSFLLSIRRALSSTSSNQHAAQEDNFQTLPDELILNILSHLNHADLARRICLVNRRFRRLSEDPFLWTSIELSGELELRQLSSKKRLLRYRCSSIRRLRLKQPYSGNTHLAIFTLKNCPLLVTLEVDELATELLEAIAEHKHISRLLVIDGYVQIGAIQKNAVCLGNMTRIYLGERYSWPPTVDDHDLRVIADHCKNLQEFSCPVSEFASESLKYFLQKTKGTMMSLGLNCCSLPVENVVHCVLIQSLSFSPNADSDLKAVLQLPRLKRLELTGRTKLPTYSAEIFVAAFGSMKQQSNQSDLKLVS